MADDKYKSAGNIRAKITRFDFEDTAKSNLAMAKQVGDVASVIEKKSDEQNRRFDKLLKVLEFIPKDVLEQRKQQKTLFTELAKTVATLEKEAKASINNRPKYFELRAQADKLREQGRTLSPDHDPSKVRNVKEFGYKLLGLNVQQAREEGIGSAIGSTAFPTFKAIGKALSGKNSFDRQVEQEKLYPEATRKTKETMTEARLKGGIEYTDEKGITSGKERSGGGGGDSIGGAVLRRIADAVVEIRNHIVGKNGPRTADGDFKDEPPKGLFTPEELEKRNPKNWKTYNKRDKNGKYTGKTGKVWNRKSQWTGRAIKADDPDLPPPEPEVLGLHSGIELTDEQKAKAAGTFDDDGIHRKSRLERQEDGSMKEVGPNERTLIKEGQDNPQPKYAESGIEKEEPSKVEGGMTGSDGGSGMAVIAILGAITEALPLFIAIGAGIATLGLVAKQIYDHFNKTPVGDEPINPKHEHLLEPYDPDKYDDPSTGNKAQKKGTFRQFSGKEDQDNYDLAYRQQQKLEEAEKRAGIKDIGTERGWNEMMEKNHPTIKPSNSGDALEQGASESSAPTVIAPTTNNITNNNGGGGGSSKSSDPGMPSARTPNPTFQRTEEKRQTRIF